MSINDKHEMLLQQNLKGKILINYYIIYFMIHIYKINIELIHIITV